MGWRLRLSDKTVRKFAELPIYCQRQKCSPGNVVSGSMRFMRGSLEKGRQMRVGSLKMAIFTSFVHCFLNILHTWPHDSFQVIRLSWPWAYFKVIGLFDIKFLKNGVWYGISYYRLLIGNHTLAFDWCHFWWPWSTFEGLFSLGCHFHVYFSNLWYAFASHGLPAIAELLVVYCNRLEWAGNRGFGPVSVILIVARSTENASVDSCHVAPMAILILESTDSDSSRRLARVCL